MHASGVLVPPGAELASPAEQYRWQVTQERLNEFLPGFLNEVIPLEVANPPANDDVAPTSAS